LFGISADAGIGVAKRIVAGSVAKCCMEIVDRKQRADGRQQSGEHFLPTAFCILPTHSEARRKKSRRASRSVARNFHRAWGRLLRSCAYA
jgi:hypothetical protein